MPTEPPAKALGTRTGSIYTTSGFVSSRLSVSSSPQLLKYRVTASAKTRGTDLKSTLQGFSPYQYQSEGKRVIATLLSTPCRFFGWQAERIATYPGTGDFALACRPARRSSAALPWAEGPVVE